MQSAKLIFLVGMPGVGKTYWGEQLALHWGWTFLDLDQVIEKTLQLSIPEIFETKGEAYFRNQERVVLSTLIAEHTVNTVIACGGGTPCYGDALEVMSRAGTVIYLYASIPFLQKQLLQDSTCRPLLQQHNLYTLLESMQAIRSPFYEKAHVVLDAEKLQIHHFEQVV